jgi:2-hydroxycyclohexanecarboxyl-CoA dehydrogenase
MAQDRKKPVAMITGAGGGMGQAAVTRIIRDGYAVAAVDLNTSTLKGMKEHAGSDLNLYEVDLTIEAKVRDTVRRISEEVGPIDAYINLVGWTNVSRFLEENSAYWQKIVGINFLSAVYVTHAVLPGMVERKQGKIVYVTSDAGRVGQSGEAVYAGMKGGLIAFAKSIAREMARYNVNVNCTAPGPTQTALEQAEDAAVVERIIRNIPFRRRSQPEEQAAAISFLCSKDADYITGQVLSVSGGLTMT